ncbi:hypothetical protein [Plebeiibacterium marinum]|uniref:LPP20 lipoprotein n=1 Tax=Plebeiibacterium marinum TaxID=2992111 RepID=A0AAE3MHF4_9BACT|nr:hypothetical protein [Plebeiobacterium marinum]MCW3807898.1 hypothetical protein [Plebeiobacterium marinum]
MTRIIIVSLITLFSFQLYAQQEPQWTQSNWRQTQYPGTSFLTGFAEDVKSDNETIAEAMERIKNMALGNLAQSVISSVKSVSQNYAQSTMYGDSEEIKKTFETQTRSESDAEINNVKTETFHNTKTNFIYAFSYVNRFEVIGYYKANISMNIQQIQGFINTANQLISTAEKTKAKEELKKTIPLFSETEYAQGLLTAVDKNIDDSGLLMQKSVELRNQVINKLAELEQGVYIYFEALADVFSSSDKTLENKLKANLADNGCSFTNDKTVADWIVQINATSRKNTIYMDIYSSYVDAEIKLTKVYNQKVEYEDKMSKKGNSTKNYELAAVKAYENLASILSDNILEHIEK